MLRPARIVQNKRAFQPNIIFDQYGGQTVKQLEQGNLLRPIHHDIRYEQKVSNGKKYRFSLMHVLCIVQIALQRGDDKSTIGSPSISSSSHSDNQNHPNAHAYDRSFICFPRAHTSGRSKHPIINSKAVSASIHFQSFRYRQWTRRVCVCVERSKNFGSFGRQNMSSLWFG